jgi:hypothetical protein
MASVVMDTENISGKRNRTIRWDKKTNKIAEDLAIEAGYYPEKKNGGVSRLLSDLVLREAGEIKESGKLTPFQPPAAPATKTPNRKTSYG